MSATLAAFREHCRAYYAAPRHRHNTEARVAAYKSLLQRHSAITLGWHVPAIAAVLTRVELEYASGQAAETLAYHLDNAA